MTISLTVAAQNLRAKIRGTPIVLQLDELNAATAAAEVSAAAALVSEAAALASENAAETAETNAETAETNAEAAEAAAAASAASLTTALAAEYIVAAANASLTAERVLTDTTEIIKDVATAAQAKLNLAAGVVDAQTLVTAVGTDHVLIADASDSGNKKKALVSDIAALGGSTPATQADMETATSTTTFASPGRTHFHPGVAKAWAYVTVSAGSYALAVGHNITSVVKNGVGNITVTFTTAFSSANFAALVSANINVRTWEVSSRTTTTVVLVSTDDAAGFDLVCFGDQ